MIEDVVEILQRIETPGSFATRQTAGTEDLYIEVEGVGPIQFPISAAMGRKLRAAARPAPFGLKDRTLVEKNVRDCGKIPKSRIRIDQRRWKRTLGRRLEQIGRDLGIPSGARLKAELLRSPSAPRPPPPGPFDSSLRRYARALSTRGVPWPGISRVTERSGTRAFSGSYPRTITARGQMNGA